MTRRIQEGDFQDTDNILCFDLCGTGCIYFVKGFALHIYLHVFYFNKKKSKGKDGRKRNKDGNGREVGRWEKEKKEGWPYPMGNEWLLKVFEQGNDAVFYESIFLAVQGLLEKYKY